MVMHAFGYHHELGIRRDRVPNTAFRHHDADGVVSAGARASIR